MRLRSELVVLESRIDGSFAKHHPHHHIRLMYTEYILLPRDVHQICPQFVIQSWEYFESNVLVVTFSSGPLLILAALQP